MVVKNYCTQLFSRSWGKLSGLRVKMSYEQIIIIQCGLIIQFIVLASVSILQHGG